MGGESKSIYPDLTDEQIRQKYASQLSKLRGHASLWSGAHERPISAALSSMGSGIIGFIPSVISGIVTAVVAPIPVTLIIGGATDIIHNVNLQMTISEIEKIINDPENPLP